ncbi:hypothetical protein ACA910_010899 [Epithemia clementina (nom. ined.)]
MSFGDEESLDSRKFVAPAKGATVDTAMKEVHALARGETQGVRLWKVVVLFLMTATAAVVSTGTYYILKAEDDDDYTESYDLFSKSMETAIEDHANSIFLAMQSCSNIITSDAIARGAEFPFHTVENFEVIGEATRKQSGLEIFGYVPFVDATQTLAWMQYSWAHQNWVDKSRQIATAAAEGNVVNKDYLEGNISSVIYDFGGPNLTARMVPPTAEPFTPLWQISPPPFDPRTVNFNFVSYDFLNVAVNVMRQTRRGHFTRILESGEIGRLARTGVSSSDHDTYHEQFVDWDKSKGDAFLNPHGSYVEPVFNETHNRQSEIVGYLVAFVPWDAYIANLLPDGAEGVVVVVENSCNQSITYEVRGKRAVFLGRSDLHDPQYDSTELVVSFDVGGLLQSDAVDGECIHSFHIYSSSTFEDSYRSNVPEVLTAVVAGAFFFLIASFFVYDWFVNRRNKKVTSLAARSSEIVSSLFPRQVRERFMAEREAKKTKKVNNNKMFRGSIDHRLQQFLSEDEPVHHERDDFMYKSKPIADLYPETTIFFADIAGFTAWSSTREPTQVFTLLETLYSAFDEIANRRHIFKVETIGDCYVAVTGVPDPMNDHAVVMCRFAYECLRKMRPLTKKLESVLGPDTADLGLRVGLHSGAVTAGVLRGERSRFQLFGDTMNTASRMESTGEKGRIHVSQDTADVLRAMGKGHWLKQREGQVFAKGKGEMTTYWVKPVSSKPTGSDWHTDQSSCMSSVLGDESTDNGLDDNLKESGPTKQQPSEAAIARMVQWNVENVFQLLTEIDLTRNSTPSCEWADEEIQGQINPPFVLSDNHEYVKAELELFISTIASFYRDNPFHNFSHASHVAMNTEKLLSSISLYTSTSSLDAFDAPHNAGHVLNASPLSKLACVMAALIYSVEHTGAPNTALATDDITSMKQLTQTLSFQRSWSLLQEDRFRMLRAAIFGGSEEDEDKFREELFLCVIATDTTDNESNKSRQQRWEEAFLGTQSTEEALQDLHERKARVLMEYIAQASSAGHAMQHWEVYVKWNSCLFDEVYQAYRGGRLTGNPADTFFEEQLEFFDYIVTPLVDRLSKTGSFHKFTMESYHNYTRENRREWEEQGKMIVFNMTETARAEKGNGEEDR